MEGSPTQGLRLEVQEKTEHQSPQDEVWSDAACGDSGSGEWRMILRSAGCLFEGDATVFATAWPPVLQRRARCRSLAVRLRAAATSSRAASSSSSEVSPLAAKTPSWPRATFPFRRGENEFRRGADSSWVMSSFSSRATSLSRRRSLCENTMSPDCRCRRGWSFGARARSQISEYIPMSGSPGCLALGVS